MTIKPAPASQSAPIKVGGQEHFQSIGSSSNSILGLVPTIVTPPSIVGTPMVGSPIIAIDAIWNHGVMSAVRQWQVNGIDATGAGASTIAYTPVTGDIGLTLTITVIATNLAGDSAPSTSLPSAPVVAAGTFNSTPYIIVLAA